MIIITGSVLARSDTIDSLREVGLAHVHRSRLEPGCISHDVHVDVEDERHFVFVETWSDRAAVAAHFAVPASIEFVKAVRRLAAEPPVIRVYTAEPVEM